MDDFDILVPSLEAPGELHTGFVLQQYLQNVGKTLTGCRDILLVCACVDRDFGWSYAIVLELVHWPNMERFVVQFEGCSCTCDW